MGLEPSPTENFNISYVEDFYGTSYSKSGYWLAKGDTIEVYEPKNLKDVTLEITDGADTKKYSTLFLGEEFESYDKYNGFLGGNHSITRIKTNGEGEKLLIIKDSYAHCLAPFFTENFSEIVLIDLRYYKKPLSELIENESPKAVLFMYGIDDLSQSTDIVLY